MIILLRDHNDYIFTFFTHKSSFYAHSLKDPLTGSTVCGLNDYRITRPGEYPELNPYIDYNIYFTDDYFSGSIDLLEMEWLAL